MWNLTQDHCQKTAGRSTSIGADAIANSAVSTSVTRRIFGEFQMSEGLTISFRKSGTKLPGSQPHVPDKKISKERKEKPNRLKNTQKLKREMKY